MAAVVVSPLTFRLPVQALASSTGRGTSKTGEEIRSYVGFGRVGGGLRMRVKEGRGAGFHICHAEGEGKGCCGGSSSSGGESSSGGKCSSHGSNNVDVSGVGKEFDALVAKKTMQEFENEYVTGQMEGTISRDVMDDVVGIYPESVINSGEEKFLDIEELLKEARSLSVSGGFVFDADFEEMLV